MDVAVWLRSLGLSRYEAAFDDNSIDADILPDLTDGDLAQLGVNLGDRKRLLKAIASLGAIEPAKRLAEAPESSSKDAAERRPYHCPILRPCRLDKPGRKARRRGLARSRWVIPRRSLGGCHEAWRPSAE